jgi:hypothetical protein
MIPTITQNELKRVLHYNQDTGIFTWNVSFNNYVVCAGDVAGGKNSEGYIRITYKGVEYLAHRLAILYVDGYLPEGGMDHKDRVRDNNRYKNIREASSMCNARNRGNSILNTSGVKGVSWFKQKRKWEASVCISGKKKYLGRYKSFDNAVCARLAGEQCVGWSGCDSISPAYKYVQRMLNR